MQVPDAVAVPNFTFIPADTRGGQGGGVGVFVKSSLTVEKVDLGITTESDRTEVQCVVIRRQSQPAVCVVTMYRHPTSSVPDFNDVFIRVLQAVPSDMKCVIVGDININLLSSTHSPEVDQALTRAGMKQYLQGATHISGSLLDHVYSNTDVHVWSSGSYYSDHNILWCVIPQARNTDVEQEKD